MTIFAYCRVSTTDQCHTMQRDAITARYPDAVVRTEKASATTLERPVLMLLLDMVHQGDKIVVWKLDRLARNMLDLMKIVKTLEDKGASLEILDQAIDTSTASGKAFLQMLGVFAEFETNLRRERQAAGIAKARLKGTYKGRKPIDPEIIDQAKTRVAQGIPKARVARDLGIGESTLHRYLNK